MAKPICAVVGVGPSVGQAVAQEFGRLGFELVLISRNRETQTAIAAELEKHGGPVHTYQGDATMEGELQQLFTRISEEVGVPEVMVFNPAIVAEEKPSELTPTKLQPYFDLMLYGAVNSVNAVLPAMRKRGSGTLLFTGGGFGIDPSVSLSSHSIAKAALRSYAHALYKELESDGLHAATVTITRPLKPGSDLQGAAAQYVKLYQQQQGSYDWEIIYGD